MIFAYLVFPSVLGTGPELMAVVRESNIRVHKTMPGSLILTLVMLPNLSLARYGPILMASQLWSIGVEEQFYLGWPWIVRWARKWLPGVWVGLVVAQTLTARGGLFQANWLLGASGIVNYWNQFPLTPLICGGMAAWARYRFPGATARIFGSRVVGWGCLGVLLYGLTHIHFLVNPGFACVLLAALSGRLGFLSLESRAGNFLGSISYGLYMLHIPAVLLVLYGLRLCSGLLNSPWAYNLAAYPLVFGLAIGLAWSSYRWLEMPFLRMKSNWAPSHRPTGTAAPSPAKRCANEKPLTVT